MYARAYKTSNISDTDEHVNTSELFMDPLVARTFHKTTLYEMADLLAGALLHFESIFTFQQGEKQWSEVQSNYSQSRKKKQSKNRIISNQYILPYLQMVENHVVFIVQNILTYKFNNCAQRENAHLKTTWWFLHISINGFAECD